MCVPLLSGPKVSSIQKAKLDSLRKLKCPRYMSSAAEYYRNCNWRETVQMYSQIIELGCDEYDNILAPPEEIRSYIDDKVPYMARRLNNREQTPQLITSGDVEKILIKY